MGNESGLSLCPHNGIKLVNNCTMIAGVECYGKSEIFADMHSSYIASYIAKLSGGKTFAYFLNKS